MVSKKFKWVSRNRMVEQAVYKFASHWRDQMTSEELHQWYVDNLRNHGQWLIGNVIPTDPAKLERKFWDDVEKAFRKEFSIAS